MENLTNAQRRQQWARERRRYWRLKFATGGVKLEDIPATYRPSKNAIAMGNLTLLKMSDRDLSRFNKLSREKKCQSCEIRLASRFAGKPKNGFCESCAKRKSKLYA